MSIVTKSFALKLSSESAEGVFSGVACPFNVPDSRGDVISANCFKKSLAESATFPLLWAHSQFDCIGHVTAESDLRAMRVTGRLLIDDIPRARETFALLRSGSLKGISIGFISLRATPIDGGGTRFDEGRLAEVSLVACPAFEGAAVDQVRSLDTLVRGLDAEALRALRRAVDAMLGREPEEDPDAIAEALESLNLGKWR